MEREFLLPDKELQQTVFVGQDTFPFLVPMGTVSFVCLHRQKGIFVGCEKY